MRDGVGTAFLAGLFLVGVLEAGDDPVDHTKIAVKFAIGLVLLVLVMANLRKEWIPAGLYWAGFSCSPSPTSGVALAGPGSARPVARRRTASGRGAGTRSGCSRRA